MNKIGLAKIIAKKTKFKISDSVKFIDTLVEAIAEDLKNKGKVSIVGFGIFSLSHRKARTGVNPKTGEKIPIGEKFIPVFKMAKTFKDIIK